MKIVAAVLGYIWDSDPDSKAEKLAKRRAALAAVGIEFDGTDHQLEHAPKFILTEGQVTDLLIEGQELKVEQTVALHVSETVGDMIAAMQLVAEKLDNMKGGGDQYNAKCEVHMPGNALMTYNVTMLLEDSCTDALQQEMDKGWRIIAACPQPDSRRPDYILGRYDPTHEPRDGAYRRRSY